MRLRFAESGKHGIPKPGHAGKKNKPVHSQWGLFLTRSHSLPVPGTGQAWTCLVKGMNSHIYVHITGKPQPLYVKCLKQSLSWLHSWRWQALPLCWNNRAARGSSCQRLLSTHSHLLPPTPMHCFSELSGWHLHAFRSLLLFSRAPSSPSLLYLVQMSTLRNHSEELELEETLGELLSPTQESRPQHLCLCLRNAREHPGASLPFLRHVEAGAHVHRGEGCKWQELKLGMLSLGSRWDSDATVFTVQPMPGFWLLSMDRSSEIPDIRLSLTLNRQLSLTSFPVI